MQIEFEEYLSYNPETGIFTWIKDVSPRVRKGNIAGSETKKGYLEIKFKGKSYKSHRLAWYMTHHVWPENQIDHVDRNKQNNSILNLRQVDNRQNQQNTNTFKGGITKHISTGKWRARITVDKVQISLGLFPSKEEAQQAYENKYKELYNEE